MKGNNVPNTAILKSYQWSLNEKERIYFYILLLKYESFCDGMFQ